MTEGGMKSEIVFNYETVTVLINNGNGKYKRIKKAIKVYKEFLYVEPIQSVKLSFVRAQQFETAHEVRRYQSCYLN